MISDRIERLDAERIYRGLSIIEKRPSGKKGI